MINENIQEIENVEQEQGFNSVDDALDKLEEQEQENEEEEQQEEEIVEEAEEEEEDEIVALEDGEEIGLKTLKEAYEQNKEYTQNVEKLEADREEIENLRKSYGESVDRIKSTYDSLTRLLEGVAFAEPDPQLAHSDPASYQYQTALRNNALAQLQNIYAGRERSDSIISAEMQEEMNRLKNKETEKLLETHPELKNEKQKKIFDENNKKTAIEFGFQEDEIDQTIDHRILQLVHYARIGKLAEFNRKNAGKRIAEKPKKGARGKNVNAKIPANRKAMQKLDETGSIHAAMEVEFE